ncbi:MAG: YbaK/EbsC family protein [Alphaproteobacteria bacterium]|jgi:Ala-tRNA(Pro) deacylase|nr:YbaK/EbsC family protein [Alphaproteobacteria bacterium]
MAIAMTIQQYLSDRGVEYDTVTHTATGSSMETAQASKVMASSVAKGVLLKTDLGYLLAVLPATHHIQFAELKKHLDQTAELASEDEIGTLFQDCDLGAVPALGAAYGVPAIVDDSLSDVLDVYIEGGDHTTLVHLTGAEFQGLVSDATHARFSVRD